MSRLTFADLSPVDPDCSPTPEQVTWLSELARNPHPEGVTTRVGRSLAAGDSSPIVSRDPDGTWRAGRYIGELYRDGDVLEIKPRLGIATIARWAEPALNVRILPSSGEPVGIQALFIELLAAIWRAEFVNAARHGLPGLRSPHAHVSEVAKGRLDITQTLRLRAAGRPQIASVNRPKNVNNAISRTIVCADRVLGAHLQRHGWRGERVDEVLPRLRSAVGARPRLPSRRELSAVRYTPITLAYKRLASLSHQIATLHGFRSEATGDSSDGLLFDVAELWELFLLHCAKEAFGSQNVTHGTALSRGRSLLQSYSYPDAHLGRLYPDIVIGPIESPLAIIDAKYKPLNDPRGVDREDLYQLHAYLGAHSHNALPFGALAYVRFPEQTTLSYAEAKGPWHTAAGHRVTFARFPITEAECIKAMKALVSLNQ